MNVAVREKERRIALMRGPTILWWHRLRRALGIAQDNCVCKYNGVWVVEKDAWGKAMEICRSLPAGGRHVAKEYDSMWYWIGQALKQGETK